MGIKLYILKNSEIHKYLQTVSVEDQNESRNSSVYKMLLLFTATKWFNRMGLF